MTTEEALELAIKLFRNIEIAEDRLAQECADHHNLPEMNQHIDMQETAIQAADALKEMLAEQEAMQRLQEMEHDFHLFWHGNSWVVRDVVDEIFWIGDTPADAINAAWESENNEHE